MGIRLSPEELRKIIIKGVFKPNSISQTLAADLFTHNREDVMNWTIDELSQQGILAEDDHIEKAFKLN